MGVPAVLCEHNLEIDRPDEDNLVYHFTLDVDAEHIREMLDERGIQSDILAVDYATRLVWERLMGAVEDVLDEVVEDMPKVGDDWDMLDDIATTHIVYDEPEFWLALENHPEMWNPPSFRIEGRMLCKDQTVADAVRANADKYPSFAVKDGEDGGVAIEWEQFFYLNLLLASAVEKRFKKKFDEEVEVRVLASEFGLPVRGDALGEMRDEVRSVAEGLDAGTIWNDDVEMRTLGTVERGRIGELDELFGAILSVDGAEGMEFHLGGRHIQALEDGSNMPAYLKAMESIDIGVPQYAPLDPEDPDIPF